MKLKMNKKANIDSIHYVYMLLCEDNSYYTGYTNDLDNRIKQHNLGKASKYTRVRLPVSYVFCKGFKDKSTAMSFEYKIKQLSKEKKNLLISYDLNDFW